MNHARRFLLLAIPLVFFLVGMGTSTAQAQTGAVGVTLNFTEYDVVYLTDWIDVKTQKVKESVPNFSLQLDNNTGKDTTICLYIQINVQLQGKAADDLYYGFTRNFKLPASGRFITAREFSGNVSNSDLEMRSVGKYENKALRKVIEDEANKYATAAAGAYRLLIQALPSTRTQYDAVSRSTVLGQEARTIVVSQTTPTTLTDLVEPRDGSFFSGLSPSFTWSTQATRTTLRVYEVLCSHRTPQDAMSGTPYLVQELTGITSLTYPTNAPRQLQQDRAYVWVVDGAVSTSRGLVQSPSKPFVFRVTDDKVGMMLDNFFNQAGGQGQAVFSNLRSDQSNWVYLSNCARATIDGRSLTEGDLQTLLNDLGGQQDVNLQVSVENQ
jgi:hypothetical protein